MREQVWNILIIGDLFVTCRLFRESLEKHLLEIAGKVNYVEYETAWPDDPLKDVEEVHEGVGDVDAVVRLVPDADIIVTDYGAVTRRIIEAAPCLKLIACARGGPVSINVAAARERGVKVVNLPGRNSRAVAEFTVALILSQVKRISECHADMKRGIWRGDCYRYDRAPRELSGQTAGLVGFGNVGRLVAPLLQCLGMRVLVYDPYVDAATLQQSKIQATGLHTLLHVSDVVSLHARATAENRAMMGEQQFRMMKPSAYFINTARGALVDHQALYQALDEGWICGAALDIYDIEPIGGNYPLLRLNNVTCTPHIAGASKETALRSADQLAEEVARYVKSEPLLNEVGVE